MNEVTLLFRAFSKDLDCWNGRSAREEECQMPHLYPVAGPKQEHPGSVRVLPPADAVCILADKPQALLVRLQLVHLQPCEGQKQPLRTARTRGFWPNQFDKGQNLSAPRRTTSSCWVGIAHCVVKQRIHKRIRKWKRACSKRVYLLL